MSEMKGLIFVAVIIGVIAVKDYVAAEENSTDHPIESENSDDSTYDGLGIKSKRSKSLRKFSSPNCASPPVIINGNVLCSTKTNCQAKCHDGYRFPNGELELSFACFNKSWKIQASKHYTSIVHAHCEPICLPECKNNGICIGPNNCRCSDNYSGFQCQFENKPCLNNPPLYKNAQRKCNTKTCTINCLNHFSFPDGSSVVNLICKHGNWEPTRSDWVTIPDCQPICDPSCKNNGICLPLNTCQCPQGFRGSQCQYHEDNCLGSKLGYNGPYSCTSGDDDDTYSCVLSCDQSAGLEFDITPAPRYVCNYATGRFEPQPVPRCLPATERRLLISSSPYGNGYQSTSYVQTSNWTVVKETGSYIQKSLNSSSSSSSSSQYEQYGIGSSLPSGNNDGSVVDIMRVVEPEIKRKPEPGTCFTWAGLHYKTFDGRVYSFDSHCSYTLIKDNRDGLFTVTVQNDPRCRRNVTHHDCPRIVRIFIQGKEYQLATSNASIIGGKPEFRAGAEGKVLNVPLQLINLRVEATVDDHLVVSLDAVGLIIKWDGKSFVQIEASESLWNRTDGLCGNMNGDRSDDFGGRRGIAAVSGWKVDGIGEICEENFKHNSPCLDAGFPKSHLLEASEFCAQLLMDSRYRDCRETIDLEGLESTCRWGYCINTVNVTSKKKFACDAMNVYVSQCAHKGLVHNAAWRNSTFCPLECTGGRVYSACGPRSQPICGADLSSNAEQQQQQQNQSDCSEGCFCPPGSVLHEGQCINPDNCPCRLRGKIFEPGATMPKDCNTCTCLAGRWFCSNIRCSARCSAIGDPHYTTFDGKRYDFMGQCSYYLVKLSNLSIEVENSACPNIISEMMGFTRTYQDGDPSCTKAVTIRLMDDNGPNSEVSIKLKQNRQISVNNVDVVELPALVGGARIRIASSIFVKVDIPNGIEVMWDGVSRVYVTAPAHFRGKTKGLCGTFTSNQKDDFLTPDGDVEQSAMAFANKWKINEKCVDVKKESEHPCDLNPQKRAAAEKYCSVLKKKIFFDCHWHVDPEPFLKDCLYDMCACESTSLDNCLCPTLSAYAQDCAQLGIALTHWRDEVPECRIHCPGDQEYQVCGNSCARSCVDISLFGQQCKEECVEGCNCPRGFALDVNGECIPVGQCPCSYAGLEFVAGYREVRPGTKSREFCSCAAGLWNCRPATNDEIRDYPPVAQFKSLCNPTKHQEVTTCEPVESRTCRNMHRIVDQSPSICQPGCVCKPGYVLDMPSGNCVREQDCPCYHGGRSYKEGSVMQEECNTCTCSSGKWSCTDIVCPGVCSVWGDSHYKSFDDRQFDFQGACDYVMAKGSLSDSETFEVTIRNVACGSTGVTCSKSISLRIGKSSRQESVTLTRGKSLTAESFKGLERIVARRAGLFVFLDAPDLGLVLQWDEGTRVQLRLDPKWKGRTRGLCGDFDDDAINDFKTPSGGPPEASIGLFADSWKMSELCAETRERQTDTCARHPERKLWATQRCRTLKSALFEPCHSEIPPDGFIERCILDACGCDDGGDCECLCTAIAAYAQECNARGVPVKWRNQKLCPMQCDETCSNYSPCVSTCPRVTCDNLATRSNALHMCDQDTCVEGCEPKACPDGEIYLNSSHVECVPRLTCKILCSVINGVNYYEGDHVRGDDCHECHCSRGNIVCTGSPCPITETPPPLLEENKKCRSGWSRWFNRDLPKNQTGLRSDIEELPMMIEMLLTSEDAEGPWPICERSEMIDIQCRSVETKLSYKEIGLNVDCSLDKGFICQPYKDENCPDFEIRVLCSCDQSSSTTTEKYIDECHINDPYRVVSDNCFDFLQCSTGIRGNVWIRKTCGPGTMFNEKTQVCDFPFNVAVVRPECLNHTRVPATNNCTSNERWESCAIECSKSCDYYKHELTISGICNPTIDCVPDCVPIDRHCNGLNRYWRDERTCVDKSDCTCKSRDGRSVKPGALVKENECEICQCINNYYACTNSCQTSINQSNYTTKRNYTESRNVDIIIVPSIVSPPRKCDEINHVWLIEKSPFDVIYSASSYESSGIMPNSMRLHRVSSMYTWRPKSEDPDPWIEIKLQQPEAIYGIIVGGDAFDDKFVTSYMVLYSDDGHAYSYVVGNDGLPRKHSGPVSADKPVKHVFKPPIEAKIVRISPTNWHKAIAMQVELVGCDNVETVSKTPAPIPIHTTPVYTETVITPVCDDQMGYDDHKMSDQQVTVSSSITSTMVPNVRLSSIEIWRPALDNPDQYVEFDFLGPRNLTGVETKGGNGMWTTVYKIYYGTDGKNWNPVINDEGMVKEYLGNVDDYSSKTNYFEKPIKARFLRIFPTKWHQHVALKAEIHGCYEPYSVHFQHPPTTPPSPQPTPTLSCNICNGVFLNDKDNDNCKCERSLWWDGRFCVAKQECPCVVNHVTYAVGSSYETSDCQRCLCALGGISVCQPKNCEFCSNSSERPVLTKLCACLCQPCPAGKKLCPTSYDCVDESRWCDGIQDCPDDENGCPSIEASHVQTNKSHVITEITTEMQCETSCPPGYVMVFDNSQESYGTSFYKKHTTKRIESTNTSYTEIKIKVPAIKVQSRFGEDSDPKEYCPKFSCKLVSNNINDDDKCAQVTCPDGYAPKFDNSKSYSKNKICNNACVPIPKKKRVCSVIGKTFTTFDDLRYKYETCNHILVRDRDANEWYIIVEKVCENHDSQLCLRTVEVTFGEHRVHLHPDMYAIINGNRYSKSEVKRLGDKHPAMELSRVGNALRLESRRYPFWVLLESDGTIKIGVSEERFGHVDGMCGLFDGSADNDQQTPDGKLANSNQAFGDSWKVLDSNECKLLECPRESRNEAWKTCTLLRDATFDQCSKALDREKFITSCMESNCACLSSGNATRQECRCRALSSFVTSCLATDRSVDLSAWRTVYDCPAVCNAPFVHKDCFRNKCEMSCENLQDPNPCPLMDGMCVPGCFCPDGLVRYGETCLPPSECRDCICSGFGSSKYITFDDENLFFDGNCTYVLTRDVAVGDNSDNKEHAYQVLITNGACTEGACVEAITVLYRSHTVQIKRDDQKSDQLKALVDGEQINALIPYKTSWLNIEETPDQALRFLIPEMQLEITSYKNNFAFVLRLPSHKFGGRMEGLCGNCNSLREDDFRKFDGQITNDTQEFVNSWLIKEPLDSLKINNPDYCTSTLLKKNCTDKPSANNFCERLLVDEPFVRCHGFVNPDPYYSACRDSMCAGNDDVCMNLEAYARICTSEGMCVDWRSAELCPYNCPSDLEYRACGSGCAETCESLDVNCAANPVEGCFCISGRVWRNVTCVDKRDCFVCDDNGHVEGDVWQPDKCTECTCQRPNHVKCQEISCTAVETVCDDKSRPVVVTGTENDCCPKYTCVPIPVEVGKNCTEPIKPECGYAQVLKTILDSNGCQKLICQCIPPNECAYDIDIRLGENDLKPGFVKETDTSGCCPKTKIVCKPELCPASRDCEKHYVPIFRNISDSCCNQIECVPPKDTCVYYMGTPTNNDFTSSPDSIAKKIGESWTDGKCKTCVCEAEENGQPISKCQTKECLKMLDHPDTRDFVLEEVRDDVTRCCPSFARVACKQGNAVYRNGDVWCPDPSDPCTMAKCSIDFTGVMMKSVVIQNCTVRCELGYEYQLPIDRRDTCCGKCVPVACVVGDEIKAVGDTWHSEDRCVTSTCVAANGSLFVSKSTQMCPELDCAPEFTYIDGCCKKCSPAVNNQVLKQDCAVEVMEFATTVGIIVEKNFLRGVCKNLKPIEGLTKCHGHCDSSTHLDIKNWNQIIDCKCCQPIDYKKISVELICENETKMEKILTVPTTCSCEKCSSDEERGILRPIKKGFTNLFEKYQEKSSGIGNK